MNLKVLTVLFFGLWLLISSLHAQERLIISTFNPSPFVAVCQEVVRNAYERMGIEVLFKHYPGERAIRLADEGYTDGELYRNATVAENYPNLIQIPVAISQVEIVVFAKTVDFPVEGWSSLSPYRIGVERGFKLVEEHTQGMVTETVETMDQTFLMLDSGRVQVVVQSGVEGRFIIKKLHLQGIKTLSPPLAVNKVYHYLNKKHQNLAPEITEVLRAMERSGEIQKIRDHAEKIAFDQ